MSGADAATAPAIGRIEGQTNVANNRSPAVEAPPSVDPRVNGDDGLGARGGTAAARAPVLQTRGLSRWFGTHHALSDVNLSVGAGEITAVLGPNGAGKTTLLRTLTGLVEPSDGMLEVLGRRPDRLRRDTGAIGFVPSGDRTFYMRLSGRENLRFAARMYGLRSSVARRRCDDLLSDVGLGSAADRRVGEYSHGMQKRLSLARGLLLRPAVLLVDEATHDLDPAGAAQIRALIAAVAARGTAVLWATQHLEELPGFADAVVVLVDGSVRHQGSIDDLLTYAPRRRYVLTLGHRDRAMDHLSDAIAGLGHLTWLATTPPRVLLELNSSAVLGEAICAITRAGSAVVACREERSEMLEAFLSVVGGATT